MKMRSKMQNQKGFTLVELMVVVVILGILVAIAVPVYNNVTAQAAEKADLSNVRIIEGAIEMYRAEHGMTSEPTITHLNGTYIREAINPPSGYKAYGITYADGKPTVVHGKS